MPQTELTRQCRPEVWMRRRRQAAQRMPPLACGCRDPLFCGCRPPLSERPPLSNRWVDAGAQAARHFLGIGFVPLLELDVLRVLWRRGGDDRALAEQLHHMSGGQVA